MGSRRIGETAIEHLARVYQHAVHYRELRDRKNTPSSIRRVRVTVGGRKEWGIGTDVEKAKDMAIKALLDQESLTKPLELTSTEASRKQKALMEKHIVDHSITIKELGFEMVNKLLDRTQCREQVNGEFELVDIEKEIEDLMEKLDLGIKIIKHQGSTEYVVIVIITSENGEIIVTTGFGAEEMEAALPAMYEGLLTVKYRLQKEIGATLFEQVKRTEEKVENEKGSTKARKTARGYHQR